MEFRFRKAENIDLPVIMKLMREGKCSVPVREWFEEDNLEVVSRHISEEGFILLAEHAGKAKAAGFLIVRFPKDEADNLGEYLKLSKEELRQVAHLETAVVSAQFRGNRLQYRLFREAEKMLEGTEIRYLMATVHPDNVFSLQNMEKLGMKKAAVVRKYGGKLRNVMWKENKGVAIRPME